jgi:hypothetical protein
VRDATIFYHSGTASLLFLSRFPSLRVFLLGSFRPAPTLMELAEAADAARRGDACQSTERKRKIRAETHLRHFKGEILSRSFPLAAIYPHDRGCRLFNPITAWSRSCTGGRSSLADPQQLS